MRHRPVLAPALLLALAFATAGSAQDRGPRPGPSPAARPLVQVKPSVVNGGRRAAEEEPPERAEPRRAGLRRSPGKNLEDLRRELERIEAGDRGDVRDRAGASSSHTRRIVVRDGKVGDASDAERMLRELERELLRELPELDLPRRGSGASRSHTRRIVVRNGETIVDEETVDGRPVRPGVRRPAILQQDGPAAPRVAPRAEARASASSSHSRRRVVRNGKVVVDEETVDGRPVKPGARPPALDRRMEDLLRAMERDLLRDLERPGAGNAARELSRELERVRAGERRGRR